MAVPAGTERLNEPKAAAEVAKVAALEDPAKELLRPEYTPREFVEVLVKAGHMADAVRFFAHALPRREAIWWAIQCVKSVPALAAGEKPTAALAAAERWVNTPTDENRRTAHTAAEAAALDTPAGCAAMAVFLSEGSLAPAALQVVPPPPHVSQVMVSVAVVLSAVKLEPEHADEKYKRFLSLGNDVAAGTNRWAEQRPMSPTAPPGGFTPPRPTGRPGVPPPPPPPKGWY